MKNYNKLTKRLGFKLVPTGLTIPDPYSDDINAEVDDLVFAKEYPEKNYDVTCSFMMGSHYKDTKQMINNGAHGCDGGFFVVFSNLKTGDTLFALDNTHDFKNILDLIESFDPNNIEAAKKLGREILGMNETENHFTGYLADFSTWKEFK